MRSSESGLKVELRSESGGGLLGIVVAHGRHSGWPRDAAQGPRISAFVWGGKVRPSPTLPFGRWKGGA